MNRKTLFPLIVFVYILAGSAANELLAQTPSAGPGTEMTQMINRLGLGSDCSRCQSLAAEMDRNGPQWVRQNFDHVVSRTVSNAQNLGHNMGPIRRSGVRMMVRRSIQRSR